MKKCWPTVILILFSASIPVIAQANSGDFDGGVAIGTSYAATITPPTNGLAVQGEVSLGTASATQELVINGNTDVMGTNGYLTEVTNASSTGTTLNKLAKLTGSPSAAVIATTTDTDGIVGVVVGGAGTTGKAQIAVQGQAACIFENATTAGDFVTTGSITGGDCHDSGSTRPAIGQTIGRVLSSAAAGASAPVALGLAGAGVANNQWAPSGSNIYYTTGYVGIGTSSPTEPLDMGGGNIKMGYEQISNTCSGNVGCTATCSTGKQVLGGGCYVNAISGGTFSLQNNFPSGASSWTCYYGGTYTSITDTTIANCANIQ